MWPRSICEGMMSEHTEEEGGVRGKRTGVTRSEQSSVAHPTVDGLLFRTIRRLRQRYPCTQLLCEMLREGTCWRVFTQTAHGCAPGRGLRCGV